MKKGRCMECTHLLYVPFSHICDVYDAPPNDIKSVQPCRYYKKKEAK